MINDSLEKDKNKKIVIIISTLLLIGILILVVYKLVFKEYETYNVVNGYAEKTTNTSAYIIKKESVIDLSKSSVAVPLVEQDKRIEKDGIIAIYNNNGYQEYLERINKIDKQIEVLIKDLPSTYSTELDNINNDITKLIDNSKNTTSYIKMQEYKTKMDELANKKITLIGNLSPSGSKVQELITERKNVEKQYKSSSFAIKSTMSGCLSYKLDGLENKVNINDILNYKKENFENIISSYNEPVSNSFGIKVVDNFKAYLFIKTNSKQNEEYIKEGTTYNIRIVNKSADVLKGTLVKTVKDNDNVYCVFEVTNNLENLIDLRQIDVEVIWKSVSGITIPNSAIRKDDEKNIEYVTAIYKGTYIDIPIKIIMRTDTVSIIGEYTSDELEKLDFNVNKEKKSVALYDILMIDQEN